MGRFYFFDTVATFVAKGTTSYSESSLQIEDPGYWCDNSNTVPEDIFTNTFSSSKSIEQSFGLLTAAETNAETVELGSPVTYGGTYSSSRNNVTSPTYSWSDPSTTGTATGGHTLITTALTSVTFSAKQTTTQETATFYFDGTNAAYRNSAGATIPLSVLHVSSVTMTTTQSNYTLTDVLTTATGYHFAFVIRNAQAAWLLEPLEQTATGRISPAYSASSPVPSASSFSATSLSGTHSFLSLSLGEVTTSGLTVSQVPLRSGVASDGLCGDGVSQTTQSGSTGPIFSTYATTSVTAQDILISRSYVSLLTPRQMPESGITGISGRAILAGLSASPHTYVIEPPVVGISLTSGLIGISCLNGGSVLVPYWFTGKITGSVGGSKATLSWVNASSLAHTRMNGTSSVSGLITFATTQTDASQVVSAPYTADTNFYRPPLQRSTGTLFDGVESYGDTSGSYQILSTNSSGGTSSFTTTGTHTRALESTDWSRPIRKDAKTYAYTTSSSSSTMTVLQGGSHAIPVFSGFYGSFYDGYGTSQMLAEEESTFRLDRLAPS